MAPTPRKHPRLVFRIHTEGEGLGEVHAVRPAEGSCELSASEASEGIVGDPASLHTAERFQLDFEIVPSRQMLQVQTLLSPVELGESSLHNVVVVRLL
eukprot:753694-Heterocapsa_arctica.AAC.1